MAASQESRNEVAGKESLTAQLAAWIIHNMPLGFDYYYYSYYYYSYRSRVLHQVCLPGSRSKTVRAMRRETCIHAIH